MDPEGVLLTGVFGSGKTTVAIEMAEMLEAAEIPYAAIDIDWLWWFGYETTRDDARNVLANNLSAVVGNYLAAGMTRFVMAWALKEPSDLAMIRRTCPFPVAAVEFDVPIEVVASRLHTDPTEERLRNLETARRWRADGIGEDLAELRIDAARPVREVATEVLERLGWDISLTRRPQERHRTAAPSPSGGSRLESRST
jgi:thymidylate kinase